ncbi:MAG TPA: radical SAM protein, partial [bacterium]|nr:radical SAM protein [bacterium]
MKVLLINPHTSSAATAGKYKRFLSPMPPISLAYIAAALDKAEIPVTFFDDYTTGGDRSDLIDFIKRDAPDVVGLSCVTSTAPRTYDIAAEIRNNFPSVKIVMGNLHPSVFHKEILNKGLADAVVIGEGEETIVDLVRAYENGAELSKVLGIAYNTDEGPVVNTPRPFIQDLDSLPYPAWKLFPTERYKLFNFARVKNPGTLVLGSRGCPFGCNFCSLKVMGRARRMRSAASIADEFEHLFNEFGYVQPSFIDPIFPFSEKEATEFSNEIMRRGLQKKLTWITETRVDLVNENMLRLLKEAGLSRIMYGFETGTEVGLHSIKKSFTMDKAREAVEMTKKAGIEIIGFFMIGVPEDSKESIEKTIRYAKSLDIDFAKFTVFSPFPGTQVYDDMKKNGRIPDNEEWERFTSYPTKANPAIFIPDGMTNDDVVRLQRKAFLS